MPVTPVPKKERKVAGVHARSQMLPVSKSNTTQQRIYQFMLELSLGMHRIHCILLIA